MKQKIQLFGKTRQVDLRSGRADLVLYGVRVELRCRRDMQAYRVYMTYTPTGWPCGCGLDVAGNATTLQLAIDRATTRLYKELSKIDRQLSKLIAVVG